MGARLSRGRGRRTRWSTGLLAGSLAAALLPAAAAWPSAAAPPAPSPGGVTPQQVVFQDEGNHRGWSNPDPKPQKRGVLRTVSSPTFKGTTAIEAQQTYISSDKKNYHSEVVRHGAQRSGQDVYYGQAIFIPASWKYHAQPVCFQQWSPENPGGPWLLMHIVDDELRYATRASGYKDIAPMPRGKWVRIVTRINWGKTFEVWVDGKKVVTDTQNTKPPQGSSVRWSSGLYPTYWDTEAPKGDRVLSIFHDHARIATSYAEAEPANWG